jgi:predicted phage terminase large subunit-like protein
MTTFIVSLIASKRKAKAYIFNDLRLYYHVVAGGQKKDKANGPAVVQRLKINVPGVIEINPQGGKAARMFAAAPEWQGGDWYVDRNAAWTEPFIQQITMFPNAAHDDMADMMSQASAWLLQRPVNSVRMSDAFSGRVIYEYTW